MSYFKLSIPKLLSTLRCRNIHLDINQKTITKSNIFDETEISTDHITPELQLHLISPKCRLWSATSPDPFIEDPFWAFYWPGGQSLSRYVLDNDYIFKKKRILDFGSGCGACGLSALKSRAASVLFNDIDEAALVACEMNLHLNGFSQNYALTSKNLVGSDLENVDIVFAGDMFYDVEFSDLLFNWFIDASQRGKRVFIGDPGRFALSSSSRKELCCVGKYKLLPDTILENKGFADSYVWEIRS